VTPGELETQFGAFYAEARRLQSASSAGPELLVGAEIEWIQPAPDSKAAVERLLNTYRLDLFVGSVHHVHGVPIDYDRATYELALNVASEREHDTDGENVEKEDRLFADYFDAQFGMLQAVRPPVVGHFDVIRLWSSSPDRELKPCSHVWAKIARNLSCVKAYGGLLEVNSAALRKGLQEPYPKREIVEVRRCTLRSI
jgi:histidinol-phosphatase (PHP family)